MKSLVLLAEGQGDAQALPILVKKLLIDKKADDLVFVDRDVIRETPSGLAKWDKQAGKPDMNRWVSRVTLASRRPNLGGVLAVYDGDCKHFPAGSGLAFCAAKAARLMVSAAALAGAGSRFSLSVVFACVEYETWLLAGAESFVGHKFKDGRRALLHNAQIPARDYEALGKGWLERNCPGYRPARDQGPLTELLNLEIVRLKGLRSFRRLEHAVDELLHAMAKGSHISTPGQ